MSWLRDRNWKYLWSVLIQSLPRVSSRIHATALAAIPSRVLYAVKRLVAGSNSFRPIQVCLSISPPLRAMWTAITALSLRPPGPSLLLKMVKSALSFGLKCCRPKPFCPQPEVVFKVSSTMAR